ncbi:MAG: cysteine dioxygenase [Betaproteobacteria bacterium]|nr:MAG: cysteine dioxygenase [Betaproteobacteria bacterium]
MERARQRRSAIEAAVADIRVIEKRDGVTRQSLERIKQRLLRLAARTDLFAPKDYPPPAPGGKLRSCLYRLSEDADHRFALYANASLGGYGTPAHNHTTWAVIVGVTGTELNRFYERTPEGVREKGHEVVQQGTGVAFMPEDLHSIHIEAPLLNFHLYGLALEQLHRREFYQEKERRWEVFPAHSDIREARA